ncbi:hypothetical protein JOD64_001337 [Micromonospora luteifusca]|uniref:Uncharacterized protein n=1 Tax=Micromonospora luteifusca TaxID=709860 RepID=A0ABS2LPK2_9ACTN|nr:hypothetical protein [Micromonospora luteifusca]MBM7490115.1 hypothetical protein [Micromonospora luteifusca]
MTSPKPSRGRYFRFARLHLGPRFSDTVLHRNMSISLIGAGALTFAAFRLGFFPALEKIAVKDFVAGLLAYSALGFGASTAAAALALSIPKTTYYYTMIVNGPGSPVVTIDAEGKPNARNPEEQHLLVPKHYGSGFRSLYGDLVFTFLWTMVAQLSLGVGAMAYFAIAGDVNLVDHSHCLRSRAGFFLVVAIIIYALLQMLALLRAMADYALLQEAFDRRKLGL